MNKLLLLVLSILTIGLIGCGEMDDPHGFGSKSHGINLIEVNDPYAGLSTDELWIPPFPKLENHPNFARMKFPVEDVINCSSFNFKKEFKELMMNDIKHLKKEDSLWLYHLNQAEIVKNNKISSLDKSDPDYNFLINQFNLEYEQKIKAINDYYDFWIKVLSGNISSKSIGHLDDNAIDEYDSKKKN